MRRGELQRYYLILFELHKPACVLRVSIDCDYISLLAQPKRTVKTYRLPNLIPYYTVNYIANCKTVECFEMLCRYTCMLLCLHSVLNVKSMAGIFTHNKF
jgi:hypothetical protein